MIFTAPAAEFPCDLFYMDTNGTWADADGDGEIQCRYRRRDPEIWVGRIWTPTLNGNDAALINNYFDRNHFFRTGNSGPFPLGAGLRGRRLDRLRRL